MSADIESKRVPDHLVGTRAGLFHVLRGSDSFAQDDPMASVDLPRAGRYSDVSLQAYKSQATPVYPTAAPVSPVDWVPEDEFYFVSPISQASS